MAASSSPGASGQTPVRYDVARSDLERLLDGEPRYRADQVWRGLHQRGLDPEEMTDLPRALRARLGEELRPALALVAESENDAGDTVKSLWSLAGGRRIETVLMRYHDRVTVCISSQVGCGMGCVFCATGQAGLRGQLTMGEIVEQVIRARRRAEPRRLGNVVFMGMGEPLANYAAVWAAIERLHDDVGISARRITVSTVAIGSDFGGAAVMQAIAGWADQNGLIPEDTAWSNPFAKMKVREEQSERTSFETAELKLLFAAPVFTKHEYPEGARGPAPFWLPLLALFTGARQAELAGLTVGNIQADEETATPLMYITSETSRGKRLKTASSQRL